MIYLQLFFSFLRVGLFTFGGGFAMLPIMERIVSREKQWVTEEELADLYAIGQVTPGIIAVNTATFVGIKQKGTLGGIAATLGIITPSLVIVTIIASVFDTFLEIEGVRNALSGMIVAVCALLALAVYKIAKASVKGAVKSKITALLVLGGAFAAIAIFGISPVIVVAVTAVTGVIVSIIAGVKKKS